jgi:uncharacterized protein YndB with AHSA1/START domain
MARSKLTFGRTIAGPPDKVFGAFLSAEALKAWWSPEGYEAIEAHTDPRVGGEFHVTMRSLSGADTVYIRGVYLEISPLRRIRFTHCFEPRGSSAPFARAGLVGRRTVVTVEFTVRAGGTELTLTQEEIPSLDAERMLRGGWEGILAKLDRHTSHAGGPDNL